MKVDGESRWVQAWFHESDRRGRDARWWRLIGLAILATLVLGGTGPPLVLLDRLGSWPGFGRGPARDVAVASHMAFVAIEEGGLLVVDVTDPAKPVRVASYPLAGQTQFVRLAGSRAYVATRVPRGGGGCTSERWRGCLVILDVSDPAKLVPLGNYTTSREIQSLAAEGDRVYLCDTVDGLHIVDVTDPARPVALSVGKPDDCRGVNALCASGSRLYCVMYERWVAVDVSRPTWPTVVSTSEMPLPVRAICAASNLLLVAEGYLGSRSYEDQGCLSVFIPDAAAGFLLRAKLEMPIPALSVAVEGTTAYVAAGPAGIAAVDLSNPGQPVLLGRQDTPGMALIVAGLGMNACVADYHGGLQIVDAQNPRQMLIASTFDTGLTTRRIRVSEDKAYLVSGDTHMSYLAGYEARSRLEIVDVKDPAHPTLWATYDVPNVIMSLDVSGDLVFLGCNEFDRDSGQGAQRLRIMDFTSPAKPVCLSETQVGTYGGNLAVRVVDNCAYVVSADTNGFQILDITHPARPLLLGQEASLANRGEEVRGSGGVAYVLSDAGLDLMDIAEPHMPRPVGSVQFEVDLYSEDDCDT